uniref:Sphingosine-1-phosphate phosphatase 2-like n=1 Tax=Phallusia mammillata TaxID=59560 RepID=A0A6F9DSQ1_9ASCI|nr:sphingosine-1-phosphate phosphatase 2-like [Phallusia mammillata]
MNIISLLAGAAPVARFQRLCGVKWLKPDINNPIYPHEQPSTSSQETKQPSHVITNPTLLQLALGGSELAGEPFYYVFFPACAWLFEIRVARRTLLMLASVMYVGQSLKDILKWPRPSSPPVIRLDEAYETEYGMPSTHTMCAVTVPFTLLLFMSDLYEISIYKGILLSIAWSSFVMLSRIYLGMHSILDIAAGTILSGALIKLFYPVVTWIEDIQYFNFSPWSGILGITSFFLSWTVFQLDSGTNPRTGKTNWNTARGDTAEILGWCAGFITGSCQMLQPTTSVHDLHHLLPVALENPFLRCLVRFSAGAIILGPTTLILRKVLLHVFASFSKSSSIAEAKKECYVELPYKFFTTFVSSFMSTAIIPSLLQNFYLW